MSYICEDCGNTEDFSASASKKIYKRVWSTESGSVLLNNEGDIEDEIEFDEENIDDQEVIDDEIEVDYDTVVCDNCASHNINTDYNQDEDEYESQSDIDDSDNNYNNNEINDLKNKLLNKNA